MGRTTLKFKVGQTVELINNSGMDASLGATAIVKDMWGGFLRIRWKTDYGRSRNGAYFSSRFKPKHVRGEQFLFPFMSAVDSTQE